jgi:hypothetical protein
MTVLLREREDAGARTGEDAPVQSPRFRRGLLAVLVAVVLVGALVLGWLTIGRGDALPGLSGGGQDTVQTEREAVMAQTEQFMLRMGTYGPDLLDSKGGMPEYRRRVEDVITPKFAVSFEKEAATAEQLVAQAKISRQAAVFSTGVSSIDEDSATALVAGTFTDSYPKTGERDPAPFRIEVDLVKIKGTWLVDDFSPVTGAEE